MATAAQVFVCSECYTVCCDTRVNDVSSLGELQQLHAASDPAAFASCLSLLLHVLANWIRTNAIELQCETFCIAILLHLCIRLSATTAKKH